MGREHIAWRAGREIAPGRGGSASWRSGYRRLEWKVAARRPDGSLESAQVAGMPREPAIRRISASVGSSALPDRPATR